MVVSNRRRDGRRSDGQLLLSLLLILFPIIHFAIYLFPDAKDNVNSSQTGSYLFLQKAIPAFRGNTDFSSQYYSLDGEDGEEDPIPFGYDDYYSSTDDSLNSINDIVEEDMQNASKVDLALDSNTTSDIAANDTTSSNMTQEATIYNDSISNNETLNSTEATVVETTHGVLEINPNSNITQDIINITHVKEESKIVIHMKKERYCREPYFIGRLSGPSLAKIKWEKQYSSNDTIVAGTYSVPTSERYFIEIIVIMCKGLDMDKPYQSNCLVEPSRHRITIDGAYILTSADVKKNSNEIGRWYKTAENVTEAPLFTRYQEHNCRGGAASQSRCQIPADLSRFDPYSFRHKNTDFSLEKTLKGKNGTVCFEGASHARYLSFAAVDVMAPLKNKTDVEAVPTYFKQHTNKARGYNQDKIDSIIAKNCTKAVVGSGQWDLYGKGTSFRDYEASLMNAMKLMKSEFGKRNIDLYFRSTQ